MRSSPLRRQLAPSIALQILGLMLTGLIVAQLVTLALSLMLPPQPPARRNLEEIARALQGAPIEHRDAPPLVRTVETEPPSLRSPGWMTSERSRTELARILGVPESDVRIVFYAPLPFAGASATPALPAKPDATQAALDSGLILASYVAQGPSVAGGGPPPVGAFPGGVLPGGVPGRLPGRVPTGAGPPSPGLPGAAAPRGPKIPPQVGGLPPTPRSAPGPSPSAPAAPPAAATIPPPAPILAADNVPTGAPPSYLPPSSPATPPPGSSPTLPPLPERGAGLPGSPPAPPGYSGGGPPHTSATLSLPQHPTFPPQPRASRSAPVVAESRTDPPAPASTEASAPAPPVEPVASAEASDTSSTAIRAAAIKTPVEPAEVGRTLQAPASRGLFGLAPAPMIEGDFVAAVRMAPRHWVTVQPKREGFPNSWQRRVLLWFAISFAIVGPVGYLFARRLARPLRDFAWAAERLGLDPTSDVLASDGPAEIGRAARAFNVMQSRLRRYVDDRTAMISAISHDLRTPLARMRFRLERTPPSIRASMERDIAHMEAMISSVLVFMRDNAEGGLRQRVDLRSLVECAVDDAETAGGEVDLEAGPPAEVAIDVMALQRVFENLIGNALKYGQRAHVRLFTDHDDAVVEITDEGPGLPDDELERVFQPFYRTADAQRLSDRGMGLGLAVSRAAVRAHGGDVRLRQGSRGLVAEVRIPLSRNDASPPAARAANPSTPSIAYKLSSTSA